MLLLLLRLLLLEPDDLLALFALIALFVLSILPLEFELAAEE